MTIYRRCSAVCREDARFRLWIEVINERVGQEVSEATFLQADYCISHYIEKLKDLACDASRD